MTRTPEAIADPGRAGAAGGAAKGAGMHEPCDPLTSFRLRRVALEGGRPGHESHRAATATWLAVAAARRGDREALRYLYIRHYDNVYGYVASILRNHHEAEDVTQQVFAKLIDSLARYEERGTPFLSWLLTLARNAAIDQIRSRRAVPVPEPRESSTPAPDSAAGERRDTLRQALETLPDDQREIIVLRHMGRTESAINGLHHRGRRALRAELTRLGAAPVTMAA